ncbi:MAG: hypothetical protein ABEJ31_00155 [Haloarculaceae archaeon]
MSDGDPADVGTANTMRERAGESRVKIWLLLEANRFVITAVLALSVFVAFVAVSVLLDPSLRSQLSSKDPIETLFSAMIGVVVTGTTLVVTINQLVLSQETGPLGDQRQRMSDAMDFRTYATELFESAPPAQPAAFLRELVAESETRADALARLVDEDDDPELGRQVAAFVDSLRGNAETVEDQLQAVQFGTFDVLSAALDYNYSWKLRQIERMTDEFADSIDADQRAAFDDLQDVLAMFGPAREHVKTLYFQWALVDLSQYILYLAVPALIIAGCMLAFVSQSTVPGSTLGVDNLTWVVAAAFTMTVLPFLLFTSYVLRIATAAKRTLAMGPLILRDQN